MRSRRELPGFGLSLGVSVLFVSLILLLPMSALVVQLSHLSWSQYWGILTNPQTVAAFRVTLVSAWPNCPQLGFFVPDRPALRTGSTAQQLSITSRSANPT